MFYLALRQTKVLYTDNCCISSHALVNLDDVFEPSVCLAFRTRRGNSRIASIWASYFRLYKRNKKVTLSEQRVCFGLLSHCCALCGFFLSTSNSCWLPLLTPDEL